LQHPRIIPQRRRLTNYVARVPVVRIVPNLSVTDVTRAGRLYGELFDPEVGMDLGWVGNLAPAGAPAVQLQTITEDATAPCNPSVSIGLTRPDEVDASYARVLAAGLEVVHDIRDEEWGVRRFFFRDPDGNVVNVVANR
jgi:catechol 2,3-dioxygenase-like lactoylglutathione lyase family enzyme